MERMTSVVGYESRYHQIFDLVRSFGDKYDLMEQSKNEPKQCYDEDRVSQGGAMSKLECIKLWYQSTFTPQRPLYSWAVPTTLALDTLCQTVLKNQQAGVVDIGSAGGYWGYLLEKRGISVASFDKDISSHFEKLKTSSTIDFTGEVAPWIDIFQGGPEILKGGNYADWVLFICYPDPSIIDPMASKALSNYKGNFLAYVGALDNRHIINDTLPECMKPRHPHGVRTGDPKFFAELRATWRVVEYVSLPSHFFCSDFLVILQRTTTNKKARQPSAAPHLKMKPSWPAKESAEMDVERILAGSWGKFERQFQIYCEVHGLTYNAVADSPFQQKMVSDIPIQQETTTVPADLHQAQAQSMKKISIDPTQAWQQNLSSMLASSSPHESMTAAECFEALRGHFPDLTQNQVKNQRKRVLRNQK